MSNKDYQKGYRSGRKKGFQEGYDKGHKDGLINGVALAIEHKDEIFKWYNNDKKRQEFTRVK